VELRASWPALLLGALLAGGCGKGGPAGPAARAPEVATIEVEHQKVVLHKELPGRTSPYLMAEIRPQVNGLVQGRSFTEGAEVQAGDLLYEIDPSTYQAAYASAETAVAVAKANHANALTARDRAAAGLANATAALAGAKAGLATAAATRDVAKAGLDAAEAALNRAETNAVPLRLRAERFAELVAEKAVSQQDFDDVSAAWKQAQSGIESAAAAVVGAQADLVRTAAAIQVAEAEVQRAEAGIQAAQAEIQSAEAAIASAAAAIGSAEAGLAAARINLNHTRLTAPIAGRIGRSSVTTGALVTAHQPVALATIQQMDPMYVDVPQATAEQLRLRRRMADGRLSQNGGEDTVKLLLEDGSAYPHDGKLQFRDISVDPSTGSFILRMVFPNPDRLLLPGMFVRAVLEEGVNEQAILVPQQAITRDAKGAPVALVVNAENVVEKHLITIDRAIGNQWLVVAGLKPGDRLIVEGFQRIRPGATVSAVPAAAQPTPSAN
jgi:membrane fusion protein (multidrug efflux system)